MLNSVKNNNATAPIQKQAVQNSTKSGSDFQSALNKQFFTADGSFILDKNIQVIKPKEERPVTTQEVQGGGSNLVILINGRAKLKNQKIIKIHNAQL